jgi:hypothetical protein
VLELTAMTVPILPVMLLLTAATAKLAAVGAFTASLKVRMKWVLKGGFMAEKLRKGLIV